MNKSDIDEKTKATMMLCYGYVALYAPSSLIVSRLETTILKAINPHFAHVKVLHYCEKLLNTNVNTHSCMTLLSKTSVILVSKWKIVLCYCFPFPHPDRCLGSEIEGFKCFVGSRG